MKKSEAFLKNTALDFLICPACRNIPGAALSFVNDQKTTAVQCMNCNQIYPITDGIIDFCPDIKNQVKTGLAQKFMENKAVVSVYENYFRPAFTRLGSPIKYEEEIQWLNAIATDIPVTAILDLACGTGKYSRLMNRLYKPEIVFAVDLSMPMLQKAVAYSKKGNLDNIIHIRANDESVQRVNCFGALHLFPDVNGAILEIARVSSPQAIFSCLTSRKTGRFFTGQSIFSKLFSFHFFDEERLEQDLRTAGFGPMGKKRKNMVLLFYSRKEILSEK